MKISQGSIKHRKLANDQGAENGSSEVVLWLREDGWSEWPASMRNLCLWHRHGVAAEGEARGPTLTEDAVAEVWGWGWNPKLRHRGPRLKSAASSPHSGLWTGP